jgi:hypothetical protein
MRHSLARTPFTLFRRTYTYKERRVVVPTWFVRFSIPIVGGGSKQLRINLGTDDYALASQKAAETILQYRSRGRVCGQDPSLAEFLTEYAGHLLATKSKKTAMNEWNVLERFFDARVPDRARVRLGSITTNMISVSLR